MHLSNKTDIFLFFIKGDKRSSNLKKNVIYSFFIKILSIGISLILVPMTIDFVNPMQYGIWLTISSIVAWFSFFDIVFTNGLRNKLAEALASNNIVLAKKYISTTYAVLSCIFIILMFISILSIPHLNLVKLLNIDTSLESDVQLTLILVVCHFCITFVLKIINFILLAQQQPAISSLIDLIGQALSLFAIFLLKNWILEGNLFILGLALCIPPIIILIISTIYIFTKPYKNLRPSIHSVDLSYTRDLLGLGIKFFIIQIAAIIQFQTSNIIIARFYSMEDVTIYNISYKYFGVIYMTFMIMLQPFWSAVTDAYYKNDFNWIKNAIRRYCHIAIALIILGSFMLIFSEYAYQLWLGKNKIDIPNSVSVWTYIYYCTTMLGAIFVYFVNGIGALKVQFISSLISPFIFLLTTILMCRVLHWGIYSVLIASIIANFNGIILAPLQYYKIISKANVKNIWKS